MPSARESPGAREKRKLRQGLEKMGYKPLSLHGNQYQQGWPDLMCLMYGTAIFVEIKTPGDTLKKIQEKHLKEIRDQGCISFIAGSAQEALTRLYACLKSFPWSSEIYAFTKSTDNWAMWADNAVTTRSSPALDFLKRRHDALGW